MFLHVTHATYIDDYKIEISFSNGRKGVADLSSTLHGPVFEPLKDKAFFAQIRLDEELATICWPNGADFAPEYLYYHAFKTEPALQSQFKEWGYLT